MAVSLLTGSRCIPHRKIGAIGDRLPAIRNHAPLARANGDVSALQSMVLTDINATDHDDDRAREHRGPGLAGSATSRTRLVDRLWTHLRRKISSTIF
jgi:hypothetical protein